GHRPICNRYMVRTSHARIAQCGDERSWIIGDALPVPRFYEDPGRLMGRRVLAASGVESSQAAAVEQALFVRPQRRSDVQVELVVRRMLCAKGRERCSSDGWRVRAQRSARTQWAFRSVESTRKEPVTASGWNGSRFSPSIIVEAEHEPPECGCFCLHGRTLATQYESIDGCRAVFGKENRDLVVRDLHVVRCQRKFTAYQSESASRSLFKEHTGV